MAIEDQRFYEHEGLDYESIARAAVENYKAQDVVQGGSTITQQLVRNLYRPVGNEQTLERKIKEACLALKLDEAWSKEQDPRDVPEPGLLRQPGLRGRGRRADVLLEVGRRADARGGRARSPGFRRRRRSSIRSTVSGEAVEPPQRRAQAAMRDAGADQPSAQYRKAVATKIELRAGKLYTKIKEPFFFSFVRDQLIAEYGANVVRAGGLRIYTTIDPRFQKLRGARRSGTR